MERKMRMTNPVIGPILFIAIASTGMAASAILGVKRNGVDVFATGNPGRVAVLGIVVTLSWILLGLTLLDAGWEELTVPSAVLMGTLGMVVGVLPVLFALNSGKVN